MSLWNPCPCDAFGVHFWSPWWHESGSNRRECDGCGYVQTRR